MNNELINFYENNIIDLITNDLISYSSLEEENYKLCYYYYKNYNITFKCKYNKIFNKFSQTFKNDYEKIKNKYLLEDRYLNNNIIKKIDNFNNNSYLIKRKYIIDFIELNINIYTYSYGKNELIEYEEYVIKILFLFKLIKDRLSSKCMSNGCNLYIFLTNEKKELDLKKNDILSGIHINSGFCFGCQDIGDIIIYRKEECLKVIAHELCHALGIDKKIHNVNSQFIKNFYNLKSNIIKNLNLYEVIIEYCASIFYINVLSFLNSKMSYKLYKIIVSKIYKYELTHFMFQCVKILNYNKTNYSSLIKKNEYNNNYNEKTNVFSYYILKMLLFYNKKIIDEKYKQNIFFFGENDYKNFLEFIINLSNSNKLFLEKLDIMEKILINSKKFNTLQMTLIKL